MVIRPQIDRFDEYIPHPEYLKLLLRATDGTTSGMKDFSGYGRVVTNSTGATGSTTQTKMNPYSMYFDGTDDVISVPDSNDWNLGLTFTISTWVNISAVKTGYNTIIGQRVSSTEYWQFCYHSANVLRFNGEQSGYFVNISCPFTATTGLWYHFAVIVDNGTFAFYINGVNATTTVLTALTSFKNLVSPLYVNYNYAGTSLVTGYIDELAIWKDVAVPIEELYPQRKPFSFRRA